jgi:hypothetical protein
LRDVRIYFIEHDYTAIRRCSSRKIKNNLGDKSVGRNAMGGRAFHQDFTGLTFLFFPQVGGVYNRVVGLPFVRRGTSTTAKSRDAA